jgi:cell division GTPase FtsZ
MRILAIGLGGAGCRIVYSLYTTDRRSSKVVCVQALAIDVNSDTFAQMVDLPDSAKLFFAPIDPDIQTEENKDIKTATIDIGEIVARFQNIEIGETDAIFVCCGLGGSMVDVAPHIISALRASITEPIFGLVTLPCLAEGERHSAKAADDLDMLTPLLDGIILFDNETWYKKTKALRSTLSKKEKGWTEKFGFRKSEPEISPQIATYLLLNEGIVRRISLILRAGEFKADGGLDFAEVVLDSGEVLNTMKGMGYITIGYAVERLPHNPLGFLTSLRPTGFFADEHNKKASRIVDLAKQAIYHEISTPCDMTSAHKALVLIAGPSHELSLKGFMTVRKWIDRSIAGLETRSGDYPVMNTKNVAIIIMLSGLENIPRITELKEIQNQYRIKLQDNGTIEKQPESDASTLSENTGRSIIDKILTKKGDAGIKDEMLILASETRKSDQNLMQESDDFSRQDNNYSQSFEEIPQKTHSVTTDAIKEALHHDASQPHLPADTSSQITAEDAGDLTPQRLFQTRHQGSSAKGETKISPSGSPGGSSLSFTSRTSHIKKSSLGTDHKGLDEKHLPHTMDERLKSKEIERQIIEKELQRQRMMAISGRTPKAGSETIEKTSHPREVIRLKREVLEAKSPKRDDGQHDEQSNLAEEIHRVPRKRRIIIQKKTSSVNEQENRGLGTDDDELSSDRSPGDPKTQPDAEEGRVGLKNPSYKSRDHIFEGKGIQKTAAPKVKDSGLIHTELKAKKGIRENKNIEDVPENSDSVKDQSIKQEKKTAKKDINWI